MKKIILSLLTLCFALSASAVKIYVNPGHGAWHGNCRPMETIPYPALPGQGGLVDTLGFYESNTNLWKCYYLEEKLLANGYEVIMSRRLSGGENGGIYDKGLSVIAREAERSRADHFISVHSNAGPTTTNYPSYWYRGVTGDDYAKGSIDMAKAAWPFTYDIHEQKMEHRSAWSLTNPGLYADISFWDAYATTHIDGVDYVGYYGVLRHSIPGFIVETYFHTYEPARHRALNPDWCRQDGLRNFRGIRAWFDGDKKPEPTGYVMGYVRDAVKEINQKFYETRMGNDKKHPINGAKVQLKNEKGEVIKTDCYHYVARMLKDQEYYLTDNNYNGVFVYDGLVPGTYTITVEADGYRLHTETITVNADKTTYMQVFMDADIDWELNGGEIQGGEDALPTHVTEEYTLPIPTKEHYEFLGWFDNPEGTGTALTKIPAGWEGTLYALWREIEPDVYWELNGGQMEQPAEVPTNDSLYRVFAEDYNQYYGLEIDLSKYPYSKAANFFMAGKNQGKDIKDILTDPESNWKWLGDYITQVVNNVDGKLETEVHWRNNVTAFFRRMAKSNSNVDFSQAGKPEYWGPAYQKVYGEGVKLPDFITEDYTIPTPTKESDQFIGWYDNPQGNGEPLVTLPAGYKGTVYAIWNSMTDVENVRVELNLNAPMYDLLGRQVDATTYHGVVIQNGHKYLLR